MLFGFVVAVPPADLGAEDLQVTRKTTLGLRGFHAQRVQVYSGLGYESHSDFSIWGLEPSPDP